MCLHLMLPRDIGSGRSAIATLGKLVFNLFFYFNSSARGNAYSVAETNKPQFSTESSMAIIPVHWLGQKRFTQTNLYQMWVTVCNWFTHSRVKTTSLEGRGGWLLPVAEPGPGKPGHVPGLQLCHAHAECSAMLCCMHDGDERRRCSAATASTIGRMDAMADNEQRWLHSDCGFTFSLAPHWLSRFRVNQTG